MLLHYVERIFPSYRFFMFYFASFVPSITLVLVLNLCFFWSRTGAAHARDRLDRAVPLFGPFWPQLHAPPLLFFLTADCDLMYG